MTDNMVLSICSTLVLLAVIGLVAFRLWLDYKLDKLEWEDDK